MTAQHLAGIIIFTPDPERLATFYREVLGIPFAPAQHGNIREHLECLFGNIHFALLKKAQTQPGSVTPSFRVANLGEFLETVNERGIKPLHPVIDLGEGKCCSTIADPDGNWVRLIQLE
jgi:predicted enzyme related to lactoylglutathione lyase